MNSKNNQDQQIIYETKIIKTEQEKIYQKILKYYKYAEDLIDKLEYYQEVITEVDFIMIEQMIVDLEYCGDCLTEYYIELINSNYSLELITKINNELSKICTKLTEFRAKIIANQ